MNFQTGYQPFPFIPMQQPQGPSQGVVYVPIQTGQNGKMPKPRSLVKQYKEYLELQGLVNPPKVGADKDKDKGPEIKMSPFTFLMYLLALSIPVAAVELSIFMYLGRYISAGFK